MTIETFMTAHNWEIVDTLHTPPRQKEVFPVDALALSPSSQNYLQMPPFAGHIYGHQKAAVRDFLNGRNVCLTTGTASGKSLPFQIAAIEQLTRHPDTRIIAIYPMKALGLEQSARWQITLKQAGIPARVGRIDGSVKGTEQRLKILKESSVLIFTPDIIHAWLLSNLHQGEIKDFLRRVSLIIVDEVHTYTGVFGSNSAFLFRRLRHILHLLGATPTFICASATISDPPRHLRDLFGVEFSVIDQELDTSPKHAMEILLLNPPVTTNFLTAVTELLAYLSRQEGERFITFVDSRVQVEHISAILARMQKQEKEAKEAEEDEAETSLRRQGDYLRELNVLPYRAGYEPGDRDSIQRRLNDGSLNGIVSTSALELGIDIQDLDTCILIGVPYSSTSLQQRIGRIGRHRQGRVLVVNGGTVYDQSVFANPTSLLHRPLNESTLYLENQYIQYIHALCLARLGGEHDRVVPEAAEAYSELTSSIEWPDGFMRLCEQERLGEISGELQRWKADAGETPNHTFPLRDVESQFTIEEKGKFDLKRLGSLSHSQLLREAYPGAIYYHLTKPYRVTRVLIDRKTVQVKMAKHYTTQPQRLPTQVFPNLTHDNVFVGRKYGALTAIECNLSIRESLSGLKERRGSTETFYQYPVTGVSGGMNGVTFNQQYFVRNFFTTGVVITHPILNADEVAVSVIGELLFEAFLTLFPFDRQDIDFAVDKHRKNREPLIHGGDRFIAVYDQTYGSLRLSGRIMSDSLAELFLQTKRVAQAQDRLDVNAATMGAIETLIEAASHPSVLLQLGFDSSSEVSDRHETYERIILPNSRGINVRRNNEEFLVKGIRSGKRGLRYVGLSLSYEYEAATIPTEQFVYIDEIREIPGVSEIGYYNYDTEAIELAPPVVIEPVELKQGSEAVAQAPKASQTSRRFVDSIKLQFVLSRFFSESELTLLCHSMGKEYRQLPGESQIEKVQQLISAYEQEAKTLDLVKQAYQLYQSRQSKIRQPAAEASQEDGRTIDEDMTGFPAMPLVAL